MTAPGAGTYARSISTSTVKLPRQVAAVSRRPSTQMQPESPARSGAVRRLKPSVAGRPPGLARIHTLQPRRGECKQLLLAQHQCGHQRQSPGSTEAPSRFQGLGQHGTSVTPSPICGAATSRRTRFCLCQLRTHSTPDRDRTGQIMALGDSITWAGGTTTPAPAIRHPVVTVRCYGKDLFSRMERMSISWVRSVPGRNTLGDQGPRRPFRAGEIDQIRANIDTYIANARPDVALLMIGTNDVLQIYNMASAPDRLQDLVRRLCIDRPNARIVVSTIPPRPGLDSRVNTYNSASRASLPRRKHWLHNRLLRHEQLSDCRRHLNLRLHPPTMAGYDKMALAWYPYVSHLYSELAR